MTDINPGDVLFMGYGKSTVNWYRCGLPAAALGCDWVGWYGDDAENWQMVCGDQATRPDLRSYKVVVVQQPWTDSWKRKILELRETGVTVLYEIDDCLHAVPHQRDHARQDAYTPRRLRGHEDCMNTCDGVITSTNWLADYYFGLSQNVWVCRNGLDLDRYDVTKPERDTINIGFAGGHGHKDASAPWMEAVMDVMDERENVGFINVGEPIAGALRRRFPDRVLYVPWGTIENYPAILTGMDVVIGPAGDTDFSRAKSDLRAIEAGALGIATLLDSQLYGHLAHQGPWFTGPRAEDVFANLMMLLEDSEVMEYAGKKTQEYVRRERSIEAVSKDWVTAIEESTD